MKQEEAGFTLIELIIVIAVLAGLVFAGRALLHSHWGKSSSRVEGGIGYSPPVIPLTIRVNHRGEVSVSAEGPVIPTPIGTFRAYANVSFPDTNTLTVVTGKTKTVYDLKGKAFRVSIPNDRHGQSRVEYDGRDIFVTIPEPVWQ